MSEKKFNPQENDSLGFNFGVGANGIFETLNHFRGPEGRVDIKVTNKLLDDIKIHLQGGGNKEEPEVLKSEMTRVFSKRPKDGLVWNTTVYECEIWAGDKHAKLCVYGDKAPRRNNKWEVKEKGIYLVENSGDKREEFLIFKWNVIDNSSHNN